MKSAYELQASKELKAWQKRMSRKPSVMNRLSKRFQVKDNQFIHPADMIETPRAEYVLLYDTRLDDIFANRKPQIAVFTGAGSLVSQTGLGNLGFLARGDSYFSETLLLNDKGEYFIGGDHSYVDFENSTNTDLIKINKNGTPSLREIAVNDVYDSGWPIQLTEKNGKINILGGYSAYIGSAYQTFYSYTTIDDSATIAKTTLLDYDPFVLQELANNKVIKFPSYGGIYIKSNESMINYTRTSTGYNITRYDSAGRICPSYQIPVINTARKSKLFDIKKLYVTKRIDTIVGLADYAVSVKDTALASTNCADLAKAIAMLPQAVVTKQNILQLYPNPATNFIMVDFTVTNTAPVAIQLTSAQGSILQAYTETFTAGSHQYKINTASLTPGMYFIKLFLNGKQQAIKFIKE